MAIKVRDVIRWLEDLAPLHLAEEWDNPGLQLGDPGDVVTGIMVSLDFTQEVLAEGLEKGVNLFVTHHPLIFRPLTRLSWNRPQGRLIKEAAVRGASVYALHTNLDNARGGLNCWLAEALGLKEAQPFGKADPLEKLVVFVPRDHAGKLMNALAEAGAGHIGQYSHCTFQALGKGTFKPLTGAKPYIGKVDEIEEVDEVRLETILPRSLRTKVVRAMMDAHPYEEVAYDLYPLVNPGVRGGPGRLGSLPAPMALEELAFTVKKRLGARAVRVSGELVQKVDKVALCGGSGGGLISLAADLGAQVYISGDLKYHDFLLGQSLGLALIDGGHYWTELIAVSGMARFLEGKLAEAGADLPVVCTKVQREPFMELN
ncbi:MAG: Nif3-like dinuclear metal center hexameric protein [Limnochordia bacterium]